LGFKFSLLPPCWLLTFGHTHALVTHCSHGTQTNKSASSAHYLHALTACNKHTTTTTTTTILQLSGLCLGPTQMSWYQKGKTNLDSTGARNSEWQWHQLGHMQICTLP